MAARGAAPAPGAPPASAATAQLGVAEVGELKSAAAEIGALCERLEAIGGWGEMRDEITSGAGNGTPNGRDDCNGKGHSSNGNGNGNGSGGGNGNGSVDHGHGNGKARPTNGAPSNGAPTNRAPANRAPTSGAPTSGANTSGAPTNGAAAPSGLPPGLGDGHQRRAALVRSAVETAAAAAAAVAAQATCAKAGEAARRDGMSAQGHRTQEGQAAGTSASASASRPEWSTHERELLAKAIKKIPGGVPERWLAISEFVNRQAKPSHGRTAEEV